MQALKNVKVGRGRGRKIERESDIKNHFVPKEQETIALIVH